MTANTLEQHILSIVCSVFDAYSAVLFLPSENGEEHYLAASFSLGEGVEQGAMLSSGSLVDWIIRNRQQGRNTWIYIDEIYLLFQHEYSANFLFTLWKRVRKYRACCTGITQNVDDLLQSHTARTMLANSEFLVMLNQAATDRTELARLLNISDNQLSYITNVDSGRGLIKCGSAIVPFMDNFPKNRLYKLMTTKPSDTDGTIGMGRAA